MVFHQKTKRVDPKLFYSNRREHERIMLVHFVGVVATHFRDTFRYCRYGFWHLRDYLKYSAKAAIDSGLKRSGFQKLLKRKT